VGPDLEEVLSGVRSLAERIGAAKLLSAVKLTAQPYPLDAVVMAVDRPYHLDRNRAFNQAAPVLLLIRLQRSVSIRIV
jgi:hypothetical protein